MVKMCELNPNKICNKCNMCNICDLNPVKICDSCGRCLGIDGLDYREVRLEGVLDDESEAGDYEFDDHTLNEHLHDECDCCSDDEYEYIEDIPELKEEYNKKIDDILSGKEE